MKIKFLFLLLVLIFISSISFSAIKNIEQMVFGIQKSEFEALNLSNDQKDKIGKLVKEYKDNLDKLDKERKDTKVNAKLLETEISDQVRLQYKLYADFKSILTKEQLSQYEKAYYIKLAEQRLYLTKKFAAFEDPLDLTDSQKDKYRYLINNFDGDFIKLELDFIALLDSKQKIVYNHLKEKQMNTIIASGTSNKTEIKSETKSEDKSKDNSNDKSKDVSKSDNKQVVINNNNGTNNGAVAAAMVVQPVLWWSLSSWHPRPIHHYHWSVYDRYWDVYERRWHYWEGYWDGRWDEFLTEREWDRYWDAHEFDYEQWRYEERIYDTGFSDGIDYDKKLYDKWADEPFDAEAGKYLDSDNIPEFNSYKDIYEDANLGYKLSDYYDEKNNDWDYEKVAEDFKEDSYENIEEFEKEPEIDTKEENIYEDIDRHEEIDEPAPIEHNPEPKEDYNEKDHIFDPSEYEHNDDSYNSFGGSDDFGGYDDFGSGDAFGSDDFGGDF